MSEQYDNNNKCLRQMNLKNDMMMMMIYNEIHFKSLRVV